MRWLITGGLGFIGRNLINSLLREGGHSIRIIDNTKVGTTDELAEICDFNIISEDDLTNGNKTNDQVALFVGDIRDADLAIKLCKGIDIIVHLAAETGVAPSVEDPRTDCETNVVGTLNYLEAARHNQVSKFIFASSGAPVGEVSPPIHEELPCHPVSPYGASKLAGEGYCSAYNRTFGLDTVCLRFGNVYGPLSRKKNSVVAKFIKGAIDGEPLEIYGDGNQTRDFIYIDDLVRAIQIAATKPDIGGEIFQIATNRESTVAEIADKLITILKDFGYSDTKVLYGEKRQGDVMRNYSDTDKSSNLLGWYSQCDLEEGLHKTVEWFCK